MRGAAGFAEGRGLWRRGDDAGCELIAERAVRGEVVADRWLGFGEALKASLAVEAEDVMPGHENSPLFAASSFLRRSRMMASCSSSRRRKCAFC